MSFAPRLSFFFNAHSDFLEEIAKYRAARRLYAHLMKERFGAKDPKSMMLRFHAQTAGSTLTAQQPGRERGARGACRRWPRCWAARSRCIPMARDEALGLPTEESARLALRTQQIIAYETGVTREPDPLGGSYYIEKLTDEIERGAREYIDRIDALGGTLAAIEKGFIQGEIQNAAYAYQQAVERGETMVVGVNRFQQERASLAAVFRLDPELERQQVERLRELRASRERGIGRTTSCANWNGRPEAPRISCRGFSRRARRLATSAKFRIGCRRCSANTVTAEKNRDVATYRRRLYWDQAMLGRRGR